MASNKFITTNRIGLLEDWLEWEKLTDGIIPDGEIIVVQNIKDDLNYDSTKSETRLKLGDGKKKFSELPYFDKSLKDYLKNSFDDVDDDLNTLSSRLDNLVTGPGDTPENGSDIEFGTVETEIADSRVNINGIKYPNIGEHIRSVNTDLKKLSRDLDKFKNAEAVAGLEYDDEEYKLYLVDSNGNRIEDSEVTIVSGAPGTGDGGQLVSKVVLSNKLTSTTINTLTSNDLDLKLSFYEKFDGEYTTSNGTVIVEYLEDAENNTEWKNLVLDDVVSSVTPQSVFSIPIPNSILKNNENKQVNFKVWVIGGDFGEKSNSITYKVYPKDGYIDCDFEDSLDIGVVFTNTINFEYGCYGIDISKTVYFELDGNIIYIDDSIGESHGGWYDGAVELAKYGHGYHKLEIYYKTPEGAKSNVLSYDILYSAVNERKTILAARPAEGKEIITSGDPVEIIYKVFTPNNSLSITPELTISLYDKNTTYVVERLTDVNRDLKVFISDKYKLAEGELFISFESGGKLLSEVMVAVKKSNNKYNYNQITTGLIYEYNASKINEETEEKTVYKYPYQFDSLSSATEIKALNSNFNWRSNGFKKDLSTDSEKYLRLNGDARHSINLPILTSRYIDEFGNNIKIDSEENAIAENGRTIEFTFRVSNISDINANIIKYIGENNIGFIVTPVYAALLYKGVTIQTDGNTGFIKNEEKVPCTYIQQGKKIRLSIVIEKLNTVKNEAKNVYGQCINFYINGEFAQSLPYTNEIGMFNSNSNLVFGDNSCVVDLYEVRMYKTALSKEDILHNYSCSFLTTEEKLEKLQHNDLLITDKKEGNLNDLSYSKIKYRYPCILLTGELAPTKEDKRQCAFLFTKPSVDSDGNPAFTTEFELYDKEKTGKYASYNKIQGTSSVKFPVKNYKFYLRKVSQKEEFNEDTQQNEIVESVDKVKYKLKGSGKSIGESTLCWKADYMSSDHANTFNANIADGLFDKTDIQNTSQGELIQNTIYGFRCLLFQRDDENSVINFIGDGCLNNDKGNSATFGLDSTKFTGNFYYKDNGNDTLKQKWEFSNNTDKICTWESDALLEIDPETQKIKALTALECSYPDQGDLEDAGLSPDYTAIQLVFTWLYQRANYWDELNPVERTRKREIFKREFEKHFDKKRAFTYYLFMEFMGLCDNRAKNLFLRTENCKVLDIKRNRGVAGEDEIDGKIPYNKILTELYKDNDGNPQSTPNIDIINWEESKFAIWLTDLYDLDSGFGVENNGYIHIPYYGEWDYSFNDNNLENLTYKFNGRNSRLWLMIEDVFFKNWGDPTTKSEIEDTFAKISEKGLNYENIYKEHIENNALLIPQSIVNNDMIIKYSDPWEVGFADSDGTVGSIYKYLQRGSRTSQKISFLKNRSIMMNSKYSLETFTSTTNSFSMRASNVPGDVCWLNIKYNNAIYPNYKFSDGGTNVRLEKYIPGAINKTLYHNGFDEKLELYDGEFNNFELALFKKTETSANIYSVIVSKELNENNTKWKKDLIIPKFYGEDTFEFNFKLFIENSTELSNSEIFSINDTKIVNINEEGKLGIIDENSIYFEEDIVSRDFIDVKIVIEKDSEKDYNTSITCSHEDSKLLTTTKTNIDIITENLSFTFGGNSKIKDDSLRIAYIHLEQKAPEKYNYVKISKESGMGSSDSVYIYSPENITEITNIAAFRPYEIRFEKMINLKNISLGIENDPSFNTDKTPELNFLNCAILEYLDISGYNNIDNIDLSKNYLLKKLYARRTNNLKNLILPKGGALEEIYIGDTNTISLIELPKLNTYERSGYDNISTIHIENCPNINGLHYLEEENSSGTKLIQKPLSGFRIVGFEYEVKDNDISLLEALNNDEYCKNRALDSNGNLDRSREYPYLEGTIVYKGDIKEMSSLLSSKLFGELLKKYENLKFTGFNRLESRIKVYDGNNNLIVNELKVTSGGNTADHVIYGNIRKDSTAEFEYIYLGVSKDRYAETPEFKVEYNADIKENITIIKDILGEVEYYPIFREQRRSYNVYFFNGDEQLCDPLLIEYGKNAEYPGDPSQLRRPGDEPSIGENGELIYAYEFSHWSPSPENITGERRCYAQFDFTYSNYFEVPLEHLEYEILSDTDETRSIKILKYITTPDNENIIQIKPEYTLLSPSDNLMHNYLVLEIEGGEVTEETGGFRETNVAIVDLPEGLEVIGKKAFYECDNLNIINFPSTLKYLKDSSFRHCTNIEKINYDAISLKTYREDTTDYINWPFSGSHSERGFDLVVSSDVEEIGEDLFYAAGTSPADNMSLIRELKFKVDENGESKCKKIGTNAFNDARIRILELPPQITEINTNAFRVNYSIETLDMSNLEDLEKIDYDAFACWKALKNLYLPPNIKTIANGAFRGDSSRQTNIENIRISNSNPTFSVILKTDTNGIPDKDGNGHTLVSKSLNNEKSVILGTKYSQLTLDIKNISSYAFSGVGGLESFEIIDSIESIGESAMTECRDLKSIIIGNGVKTINGNAFAFNDSLENVTFKSNSSIETINGSIFYGSKIKKLVVPETLKKVEAYVFSGMNDLEILVLRSKSPIKIGQGQISNDIYSPCLFNAYNPFAEFPMKKLKAIYVGWGADEEINKPANGFKNPWGIPDDLDVQIIYNFDGPDEDAVFPVMENYLPKEE